MQDRAYIFFSIVHAHSAWCSLLTQIFDLLVQFHEFLFIDMQFLRLFLQWKKSSL